MCYFSITANCHFEKQHLFILWGDNPVSNTIQTRSHWERMECADDNGRLQAMDYEHKVEQRAVKHREISDRNNMTLCRSPTRDLDTRWIKNELHRKRQFEFSKRRPVEHGTYVLLSSVQRRKYIRETLHAPEHMTQTLTSVRRPLITSQNIRLRRDYMNSAKQVQRSILSLILIRFLKWCDV